MYIYIIIHTYIYIYLYNHTHTHIYIHIHIHIYIYIHIHIHIHTYFASQQTCSFSEKSLFTLPLTRVSGGWRELVRPQLDKARDPKAGPNFERSELHDPVGVAAKLRRCSMDHRVQNAGSRRAAAGSPWMMVAEKLGCLEVKNDILWMVSWYHWMVFSNPISICGCVYLTSYYMYYIMYIYIVHYIMLYISIFF